MNNQDILVGRYQVGEIVYRDASVGVYRGYDQLLNRPVTIELLDPGAPPSLGGALQEKARRMALAELPHVAALYDQGEQDGRSFLILEELAPSSLADAAPLSPLATSDLVAALAATLRVAHQKQVAPPRIDPESVRMTSDGLFQVVNWGATPTTTQDDIAIVLPVLMVAVRGPAQGTPPGSGRRPQPSPLERVVESAAAGHYRALDDLVSDVRAARTTADDPTVIVERGRPTLMIPVEQPSRPRHEPMPRVQAHRSPWLPLLLVGLLVLGGAAVFGRSLFTRGTGSAIGGDATAAATSAADGAATPMPEAEPQGQPFVVRTIRGQRLNVRENPSESARIVGKLDNGDLVRVVEGPVTGGRYQWARIEGEGVSGWCVYQALTPQ